MYYPFLRSICWLYQNKDTGKLASLRRAAGEMIGSLTARNTYWIYSYLKDSNNNSIPEYVEQSYFLAGTLLAFDKEALGAPSNAAYTSAPDEKNSFAKSLRSLTGLSINAKDEEVEKHPLTRRFRILLDADYSPQEAGSELPFRLRQMVRYALQKGARISWDHLLRDILEWDKSDRRVQKRWARDYFTPNLPDNVALSDDSDQAETNADEQAA